MAFSLNPQRSAWLRRCDAMKVWVNGHL